MTFPDLAKPTVESTSTPSLQSLIFTLLRTALAALGAIGLYHGAVVPDATLYMLAGLLVELGTAAWGIWDKVQAARRVHHAAVASASASATATQATGVPAQIAIQPAS